MSELQDYLAVAVEAAHAAGKLQQFYAGGDLDIQTKSSETDLVTKADKLCEAKIREIIAAHYPEHVVLGEEGGQDGEATHRWIVDPIDGTLNYAHGLPFYCTSIGLEVDGVIQVGVVLDSLRAELFTAVKGGGAFLNGAPMRVTQETELINSMLTTGFSYQKEGQRTNIPVFERLNAQVRSIRRLGASALDLAYVACGRLDGFWELKLKPWDVAAGWLLVTEAGGRVTGPFGEPYQVDENRVVATNGQIHDKLVSALDLKTVLA